MYSRSCPEIIYSHNNDKNKLEFNHQNRVRLKPTDIVLEQQNKFAVDYTAAYFEIGYDSETYSLSSSFSLNSDDYAWALSEDPYDLIPTDETCESIPHSPTKDPDEYTIETENKLVFSFDDDEVFIPLTESLTTRPPNQTDQACFQQERQ